MTRRGEDGSADREDVGVQVWVALLDLVELIVGNLRVRLDDLLAHLRVRWTVVEGDARARSSRSSGLWSYSCWASVTTFAGCSRMLPSSVSTVVVIEALRK